MQENEEVDQVVQNTTAPRIVAVGTNFDPTYLAIEGNIIGGTLKPSSVLENPIILMAAYYVFNIQYPSYCNVYPFLEAVLFDNKQITKNKVVIHKVINALML